MQAISKVLKKLTSRKSELYQAELASCIAVEKHNIEKLSEEFKRNPMAALTKPSAYFKDGVLSPDADRIVRQRAEKIVDNLMEGFIQKQLNKLNLVIKHRDIADVKVVSGQGNMKQLQYRVVLANGQSFEIKNQVVISYNSDLKPTTRFPTTFHNIKKDNVTHKRQSQEWMEEFF